jgi:hypothetical protein
MTGTGGATAEGGAVGEGGNPTSGGTNAEGGLTGKGGAPSEGGTSNGGANATGGTGSGGGTSTTGGSGTSGSGGTASGGSSTGGMTNGGAGSGGEGADSGAGGDGGSNNDGIVLRVNPGATGHAISPNIYGINVDADSPKCSNDSARFGLCRLGGSRYSTYNWENNASNAGNALCYQNDGALGSSNDPGLPATNLLSDAAGKASALLTIPIIDYVAADKNGGSATGCTGDVRGPNPTPGDTAYLNTRFKRNRAVKGSAFTLTPDTSDAFVNQDEFVNFVRDRAAGAPVMFGLDNEPGVWRATHPEAYLSDPTYADVVARNIEYATMLRATWPEAKVLGYVGYGWNDFINLQAAPDSAGKGEFVDFYLSSMQAASSSAGKRLVDYLDIHWFPELYVDNARIIGSGVTPEARRVRVQAPRSLWDDSYVEDSWITQFTTGGTAIRLVRRMQGKIDASYPGTGLSISEWNYGGEADISGAVAAADALGVFGREGVGVAAFRAFSTTPSFVLGAFAAFRNYDGAGAHFGDTSVSATSTDVSRVSVYASTDSATPGRVVVVVINRAEEDTASTLRIQGSATFASAAIYQLSSSAPLPSAKGSVTASAGNTFSLALPAYSISVLVPAP